MSNNINGNDNNGYKSQISMTPTIQEELDEEVEFEKNAEKEMLRKSKENLRNSRYISSSSSARLLPQNSTSNTNLIGGGSLAIDNNPLRSNSTITFEKIKVIPRPRTQSEQSILSSLSLKSLLDNKIKNKTQNLDSSSTTSNKGNIPKEAQIGFQEPFTDDNRIEIDSNIQPIVTHSPLDLSGSLLKDVPTDIGLIIPSSSVSVTKTVESNVSHGKGSVVIGSDNDDTEELEASQNLTTQALRKLSMLKMGEQNLIDPNESEDEQQENNNNNIPNDKTEVATMKENDEDEDDDETLKLGRSESNFTATVQNNVVAMSPSPPVAPPPSIRHELPRIQEQMGTPKSTTHINSKVNVMTLKDNSIHDVSRQYGSNNKISLMRQPQTISAQQLPFGSTKPNLYNNTPNSSNFDKNSKSIKQINNPKKPLYVPAVLRNVSETNLTTEDLRDPSESQDDEDEDDGVSGIIGNDTMSSNGSARDYLSMYSHNATTSLDHHLMKKRGQRTTTQSSMHSTASSIYSAYRQRFNEMLGSKPDTMTRSHWIPDSERDSCHECHIKFGILERKHHCRHCGEIFCQRHVNDKIYLNQDAQFCQLRQFGGGVLVKVCHGCFIANDEYMQAIKLKKLKQMEEQNDTLGEMMPMRRRNGHRGVERNRRESIAGSVPVDWNWSSF